MSLEKAKQELDDAVTNVAQAAQMVSDDAEPQGLTGKGNFLVMRDSMLELQEALKVWKEKTQNFLSEVHKAGG